MAEFLSVFGVADVFPANGREDVHAMSAENY
jgi:hypothetical protein